MIIFAKIMQAIGLFSILIGACAMDSEKVIIPIAAMAFGSVLSAAGALIRRGYVEE